MPREVFEAIRTARLADLRSAMAAALPTPPPRFVLEIGCGNGHFLTAYAAAYPDRLCVGLDLRLERIEKAARKQDRAGLANLQFLRCDAMDFLHELPAGARLHDTYMLFPDPWPKKRHHKNRLLKAALLDALAARAGQGSRLFFRTDYKPYYDEAEQLVAAHPAWRLLPPGPFAFEHPTIFSSRAAIFHSLAAAYSPRIIANPVTTK
jgi:tRNA (guanine-N7-)-methyltransferase